MVGDLPVHQVVVMGDGGTGKTGLTIRCCLGHFIEEYDPTIEDWYKKTTTVDGVPCILKLMDTAGQEEYTVLRDSWIRQGQAYILVYSITCRESFESIPTIYDQILRYTVEQGTDERPLVYLVGNKSDSVTEREVSTQEGFAIARELDCTFIETSAKNGVNTDKLVNGILRDLRKRRKPSAKKLKSTDILNDAAALSQQDISGVTLTSRFVSFVRMLRPIKDAADAAHALDVDRQWTLDNLLVNAVRNNKRRTTSKLLKLGADVNGDASMESSPLYAAAALGHTKMVTLLLDHEAAPNAKSSREFTPLMIAAAEGHIATVEALLARGAWPNVHSKAHRTPLIAATFRCHTKVMEILLDKGADVNERGGQYGSAIHTAATVGNLKVMEALLAAGANVQLRNDTQCTALQVAAAAGHAGIVRLLLLRGARTLFDDTQGKHGSALRAANENSSYQVYKILLDAGADKATLNIKPPTNEKLPKSEESVGSQSNDALVVSSDRKISTPGGPSLHNQRDAKQPPNDRITIEAMPQEPDSRLSSIHCSSSADLSPDVSFGDVIPVIPGSIGNTTNMIVRNQLPGENSDPHEESPRVLRSPVPKEHEKDLPPIPHFDYSTTEEVPWELVSRLAQGTGSAIEEIKGRDAVKPSIGYARKIFALNPRSRRRLLPLIQNEVNILKKVRHHHVSQIHSTYSTLKEFAIVMTLAEVNLGEYLQYNPRPTTDSPIYSWFGCLATAFDYLHERKIKHQDVKPANILIKDGHVIVADFGISKDVFNEATTGSTGPSAKTLMYCAPEVAQADDGIRRGRQADMFSLGCIYLEMITTLLSKHECSIQKLHDLIQVDERRVYSSSLHKLLRYIQMLYALSRIGETDAMRFAHSMALQWCLSMLLANADSRITARELACAIERYQIFSFRATRSRPSLILPNWVGRCCLSQEEYAGDLPEPGLMYAWPALTFDADSLGFAAWSWDDILDRMTFRVSSRKS